MILGGEVVGVQEDVALLVGEGVSFWVGRDARTAPECNVALATKLGNTE